jgi:hypothetical protein
MKIPANATIRDVLPSLKDKRGYVATVRHQMSKAQKEHGPVKVRVGITGNGTLPSFRIDRTDAAPIAFDGHYHPFTDVQLSEENWSTESMTFQEIDDLLREIVNIRSKS